MKKLAIQKKNIKFADEVRKFDKGQVEVVNMDGLTVGRATFEPGWKWSECVKPIAGTTSCMAPHNSFVLSGRLRVVMDSGEHLDYEPGDVMVVEPGHDAWTLGNEPCVLIDFSGMEKYAKK